MKQKLDELKKLAVGDLVQIKETQARGTVTKIFVTGCQLHGDPIDRVEILTTTPGHYIKKNMRMILDPDELTKILDGIKEYSLPSGDPIDMLLKSPHPRIREPK